MSTGVLVDFLLEARERQHAEISTVDQSGADRDVAQRTAFDKHRRRRVGSNRLRGSQFDRRNFGPTRLSVRARARAWTGSCPSPRASSNESDRRAPAAAARAAACKASIGSNPVRSAFDSRAQKAASGRRRSNDLDRLFPSRRQPSTHQTAASYSTPSRTPQFSRKSQGIEFASARASPRLNRPG